MLRASRPLKWAASSGGGAAARTIVATLLAGATLPWPAAARAGPGKRPADARPPAAQEAPARQVSAPAPASLGSEAALRAVALVGVPYRWGGSRPATGLDCSGLVHHVFGEIGLATPRDTRGLARSGRKVARRHLQPGDLVFFNTLGRAYSHVGIYLGNGRFVHAPSKGSAVRIESISGSYWRARYNGARRLAPTDDGSTTQVASGPQQRAPSGRSSESAQATRAEADAGKADPLALSEEVASLYRY